MGRVAARALFDDALKERDKGHSQRAIELMSSVVEAEPGNADFLGLLGQLYHDLGNSSQALHFFERALQIEPENTDVLRGCGLALADAGQTDLALQFLRRAIETAPADLNCRLAAVGVLQGIEFVAEHPWYEQFLIECFDDPQIPSAVITSAALSLLWVRPAMRQALESDELNANALKALAQEPLLLHLLGATVVRSRAFEVFFTRLRRAVVLTRDPAHLPLLAGIAEQAFNTGYVQQQSEAEAALEQELLAKDVDALAPFELMSLASWRALVDVPDIGRIDEWSAFPATCQRVICRTLLEPLAEREIQTRIESLTKIEDDVSRGVQAQYEEHPYPRWISIQSFEDGNRSLVEDLERRILEFTNPGWPERPKVLVPGCGTGYQPLSLARLYPETDLLAVDLSRASLAYAIRKQQELGFTNVRFCQADLLHLDSLSERFEYIDCAGVLHHLADPLEGWRVLTGLLQPGGVMRIGLYSELARSTVVNAHRRIAELSVASTPQGIRDFRQAIMTDPSMADLRSIAETAGDFFSMGEVRDLLFHEQECRFDLHGIQECLDVLGLKFAGFILGDRDVVRRFHARYPARSQWLDLDCWEQFEAQNPHTFHAMYQFYCLKPDARS